MNTPIKRVDQQHTTTIISKNIDWNIFSLYFCCVMVIVVDVDSRRSTITLRMFLLSLWTFDELFIFLLCFLLIFTRVAWKPMFNVKEEEEKVKKRTNGGRLVLFRSGLVSCVCLNVVLPPQAKIVMIGTLPFSLSPIVQTHRLFLGRASINSPFHEHTRFTIWTYRHVSIECSLEST